MEQQKQYVVSMGAEIMYGPETDYAKVKAFMDSLAPVVKGKCTVKVIAAKKVAVEEVAEEIVEEKSQKTAPVATAKAKTTDDVDDVFGSYLEGEGQSRDFWKPKDGRNLIRILPIGGVLPSDWETPYPFIMSGVHYNVGLSMKELVYCPRLTHNKACPICQFVWKLYNTKDENDIAIAKRIKGANRVIANIIDLADVDKGVQKYAFGKTLARKIQSYMKDEEFKPLLDAEQGHNFVVIKKTVDGYPNYDDSRPEVKVTTLAQIYPNWKKEAKDLRKEIVEKSWDDLMIILNDTKKAILSTDVSEFSSNSRPNAKQKQAPAGEVIEEVSVDDIGSRIDNI